MESAVGMSGAVIFVMGTAEYLRNMANPAGTIVRYRISGRLCV